jgi:capsular exopolysaccharide synthesis family protein
LSLADSRIKDVVENKVEHQSVLKITSPKESSGATGTAKQVGMPTTGSTQIKSDPRFPLVLDHNHQVATESFSILRSRLLNVHNKLGTRTVVITSAEAGDGKTLVATNLALSLGQLASKRILFVDGDLRAGTATHVLRMRNLPGLGDYLQGRRSFDSVVHVTEFPALSIAPTGLVPDKALPHMLEGPRWAEFLEQAKLKFDLIIIDSLPLSAPVADLELLTAHCDAILFVVYMRRTNRQALQRVTSRLDAKKFLGIIVNNADEIYDYDYNYYAKRSQSK